MMQKAICTHCGNPISRESRNEPWEHDDPEEGVKPGYCTVIAIATPRRGTIERE